MIAGTLEVQMLANLARITDDMSKANSIVGNAVRDMEKILGTLGIGFSATMLLDKINSVVEGMDKLKNASEKTGASVENLSKLQFFAGVSGSSIDAVTQGLAKLSKGMAGAGVDTLASSQALKFLGLSAKDAAGNLKDPSALMEEIAKKLYVYQDGAGKSAIMTTLFGKAGAELIPTLKKMVELAGIEASVTTEQARAAEEYQIELARLNQQKEILWNTLVSALLPSMQTFVGVLLDASKNTDSLAGSVKGLAADGSITTWADNALLGVAALMDVMITLGNKVSEIEAPFQKYFNAISNGYAAITIAASGASDAIKNNALTMLREQAALEEAARKRREASGSLLTTPTYTGTFDAVKAGINARGNATGPWSGPVDQYGQPLPQKQLNFALGDAAKAAAQLKLYEGAMQSLEKQYFNLTHAGEVALIMYETTTGTLKKLTPEEKASLMVMAAKIQAYKDMVTIQEEAVKQVEALYGAQEKSSVIEKDYAIAQRLNIDEMNFAITLIGKTTHEQELLTAARKIDLDLQKQLEALPMNEYGGIAYSAQADAERILKTYETAKASILGLISARQTAERSWATGTQQAFNDYLDNATNAAQHAKDFWGSSFKGMEDMLTNFFMHGKLGVKDFVTVIEQALAKLAAQTFVVNVVGSVSGGAASGAAGSAGSSMLGSAAGNLVGKMGLASMGSGVGSIGASGVMTAAPVYEAGSMVAAGETASLASGAGLSAVAAAIPVWGWAALGAAAVYGLFSGGNDQPPPGQRYDNWATLQKTNGMYSIGSSEVPDPAVMTSLAQALNASLNDPTKYDKATLDKLVGTSVSGPAGTGSQALIDALTQQLSPAADAAAKSTADAAKFLADLTAAGTLATAKRQLEIQLMQAQGDAAGALAAQRADELAALDPTLQALQKQIYAAQDLATAANDATGAMQTLAQQVSDAQKAASSAVDSQISASSSAAQAAHQAADSYRQITQALVDAVNKISGGGTAGASDRLQALFGTAMTGNASALSALPQAGQDFLAASLATSRTSLEYARDQAKVVGMLSQAQIASTAMVNWNEYQATLLETQTGVLQAIKDQLSLPSPDATILTQQMGMLGTIAGLLQDQTTQIVSGNGLQAVMMQDQTGQIVLANGLTVDQTGQVILGNSWLGNQAQQLSIGNALVVDQTGNIALGNSLVGTQTGQIISGNATQDVIKNITALNTTYSESMLAALVASGGVQSNSLSAMVIGNATIASLLQQMMGLQAQAAQTTYNDAFQAAAVSIWASVQAAGGGLSDFDAQFAAWKAGHPPPGFASGGVASGWIMAGEAGRELINVGSQARVYNASQTRGMMGGAANDELVAEIRALRAEVISLRKDTKRTADTLDAVSYGQRSLSTNAA